jgi:hypothetical protein
MLVSGTLLLGVPYVTSVMIARQSRHPGDSHLYVPILGPWLDLKNRGVCPPESPSCDVETTNRVGLVIDGILQSLGALQIVGAFVFPERHIVVRRVPAARVTAAKVGSGYGLAVVGEF